MTQSKWIWTFSCNDRPGIVTSTTGHLFDIGGNILRAQQYRDPETNRFFMRVEFEIAGAGQDIDRSAFSALADKFGMIWQLRNKGHRKRVLMMVSKLDHCLGDLLYRMRIGELKMDVVGIVSNNPKSALNLTTFGDIPYHHFPITAETKAKQEEKVRKVIQETDAEMVVLARYMQILSNELASELYGRCINIHHSFLPGFKGAKPYHQAYQRGVKMIGATAHFVTSDLDEGPIIEQDVEHISHSDTAEDLVRKGRNIEQRVLSRAVSWALEDRILLNDQKTVVFT